MAWNTKQNWETLFNDGKQIETPKKLIYVSEEHNEKDEPIVEIKYDNIQIDDTLSNNDTDTESHENLDDLKTKIGETELKSRLNKIIDEYTRYQPFLRNLDVSSLIDIFTK